MKLNKNRKQENGDKNEDEETKEKVKSLLGDRAAKMIDEK